MKININTSARVRLTEAGAARWKGLMGVSSSAKAIKLPLWELMQVFGPGMHLGMTEMYFIDNEIIIDTLT